MTKIERFCQQNADAPDRIALAYEQMRFWEEKRRAHQMAQGYMTEAMYESRLRRDGIITGREFKRRIRVVLHQIALQKANPFGKPVLP